MKFCISKILLIGVIGILCGCDPGTSSSGALSITSVNPAKGPAAGNTLITVVGKNFKQGATVQVNQIPATNVTVTNQGTNVSFTLPSSQGVVGPASVTITNPSGESATSNHFGYYFGNVSFDSSVAGPVKASHSSLSGIVSGDFDHDKKDDVVVINGVDGHIDFFFGQTNGKLVPLANQPTAGGLHKAIIAADFNGDGTKDLAWLDSSNIQVLQMDKDRNIIGGSSLIPVGLVNPQFLAAVDLGKDKNLDLIVGNKATTMNLSGFLNQGNFVFSNATLVTQYQTTMKTPLFLNGGDIDGDGKGDIVVGSQSSGGIYSIDILFRTGDLTFNTPFAFSLQNGFIPKAAVLTEVSQPGRLDLALINEQAMQFGATVYSNNADPLDPFAGYEQAQTTAAPSSIVLTDFNQDGYADIALATGQSVRIFLGNYIFSGQFDYKDAIVVDIGQSIQDLAVGDFNGDQKPDLAATSTADQVMILINNSQ